MISSVATLAAAVDVKLRERVVPSAAVVRLGDVAEISTADRARARELAALPLMPAPAPDTQRFLRKREVEDMLAAQGVNLGEIRFDGAEQVAIAAPAGARAVKTCEYTTSDAGTPVNRHAAVLAGATSQCAVTTLDESRVSELRDEIRRSIASYLDAKSGKPMARRIECNVPERQLAMLDRATSAAVCQGGSEPWTGRQTFTFSFSTADGTVRVPVYASVTGPAAPVVVAIRPIARGDVITAASIEMRTVESGATGASQRTAVDSVEKLIGMEARQPIQAGEVVFTDQVHEPVLVKRGDVVTVVSQTGGIRVRTSARAKQDGSRGQLVQVESLESREQYDVRVVGLREAAVFAQVRPAAPEPPQRIDTAQR